jgi:hypothetical protein
MDWPGPLAVMREVDIETAGGRRTTIWPVVVEGQVYIRSWLGERGLWYREIVANPDAVLHVGREAVPVRAVAAADPESVQRASAGLRRKYAGSQSLASMVRGEILGTTLRLVPR